MNRRISLFTLRALCLIGAASLAACGWHLRGSASLPAGIMPVRIDATDEYTDFYRELRRSLLASGATLADQDSDVAGSVVRVRADRAGQRVLTVSTHNTPEEYMVFYNIEYAIERNGREIVPMQPLELTATYSYDANLALAKQREQNNVQRALARELAHAILLRLGSIRSESM